MTTNNMEKVEKAVEKIEEYHYINRKIEDNRMLLEDLESDI